MPFQLGRFNLTNKTMAPDSKNKKDLVEYNSNFFYDLDIHSPYMRRAIVDEVGVEADVREERVDDAQRRRGPLAPVRQVAELPPPQRLDESAGLVVDQPVGQGRGDVDEVVGQPADRGLGVEDRVGDVRVLVEALEDVAEALAQRVELGVGVQRLRFRWRRRLQRLRLWRLTRARAAGSRPRPRGRLSAGRIRWRRRDWRRRSRGPWPARRRRGDRGRA